MYTNELLEEKYKAQKQLFNKAKSENKNYLDLIEEEVKDLFSRNNWNFKFSKRKGSFLKQSPSV
jgi:(p)ppGpp synthase/HD superfamily hydrolase